MENIIRSVAVETSNFIEILQIEICDLDLFEDSPPEIAAIYGGVATATKKPAASTNRPQPVAAEISGVTNTQSWSSSLQSVLDQPPSNLPNRLLIGGMAFCTVFGAWAWVGTIDQVGQGRGQLIPEGEVYKIHPVDVGKVVNIAVKEGQEVKKGQVIAELDTELAANEVQGLRQQVAAEQIQLSQTQGLIDRTALESETRSAIAKAEEKAAQSAIASANAKLSATRQLLAQLQTQLSSNAARRKQLEPLLSKSKVLLKQRQAEVTAFHARLDRLAPLLQQGAISRDSVFEAERALRSSETAMTKNELEETPVTRDRLFEAGQAEATSARSITQSQGEYQQIITEINRSQAELAQKQASSRALELAAQQKLQQMGMEMSQLRAKIAETQTLLKTAQAKLQQRYLYAPTDGVVSSLNVRRTGEVVQPGQTIAEIAQHDAPLILTAFLPNREAGFVKIGMPVKIKLDAYPYQSYGVISGKVTAISPDAKVDEKLGPVYRVEVALERNYVMENHQTVNFKAGQTATAEIIVRSRRIADMLIEPIKQLKKGGISS